MPRWVALLIGLSFGLFIMAAIDYRDPPPWWVGAIILGPWVIILIVWTCQGLYWLGRYGETAEGGWRHG